MLQLHFRRRTVAALCALVLTAGCVELHDRPAGKPDSGTGGRDGGRDASAGAGQGGAAGTVDDGAAGSAGGGAAGATGGDGGAAGRSGSGGGPGGSSGADASDDAGSEPDGAIGLPPDDSGVPRVLPLDGYLSIHDPSIISADGAFWIFGTGPGIQMRTSTNLLHWEYVSPVFASNPAWIATAVPGARDLWAPDISFFGGQYHLYYAASTFGSNASCIGHATSSAVTGPWVDRGAVICSRRADDWNAIDPNVVIDETDQAWLAFGSFWSGIKMIRLDSSGQRDGGDFIALATRPTAEAIEAPYIVRHDGYYYLFVSFDLCCKGTSSTYRIMVGRSSSVSGPYEDALGTSMLEGGGTLVVAGNQRWKGPGHNAVLFTADVNYLVYHAYDAADLGSPTLRISEFVWDEGGWPVSAGP